MNPSRNRTLRPLLVVALLGTGCFSWSSKPADKAMYADSPKMGFDGSQKVVDLLARGFLANASSAEPGFAYYAYLLFTDRAESLAAARRQAAISYLELLDTSLAEERTGVPWDRMAVLYAPIVGGRAEKLIETKDPELLLRAYNYDRAQVIATSLLRGKMTIPEVAIVGCPHPLDYGAQIDVKDVAVVDLTASDDNKIRERIQKFSDGLKSGSTELGASGEPLVLRKVRKIFGLLGWSEGVVSSFLVKIG